MREVASVLCLLLAPLPIVSREFRWRARHESSLLCKRETRVRRLPGSKRSAGETSLSTLFWSPLLLIILESAGFADPHFPIFRDSARRNLILTDGFPICMELNNNKLLSNLLAPRYWFLDWGSYGRWQPGFNGSSSLLVVVVGAKRMVLSWK